MQWGKNVKVSQNKMKRHVLGRGLKNTGLINLINKRSRGRNYVNRVVFDGGPLGPKNFRFTDADQKTKMLGSVVFTRSTAPYKSLKFPLCMFT
jgi:hypothetical protein